MRTVYSALKVFGYAEHVAAAAPGSLRAPVHVRIKPVNACAGVVCNNAVENNR